VDLGDSAGVARAFDAIERDIAAQEYAKAVLINNAGIVEPVAPLDRADPDAIERNITVNLTAPLVLMRRFLAATEHVPLRRVINVSSGAGRRPIFGWSAYCAAKAGLDHFSRVTALDEPQRPNPARIVSLAPGVIDTDMQGQLRTADPSGFPEQSTFINLKASGQLPTPEAAATRVLTYLARGDFGTQPVADVRDA